MIVAVPNDPRFDDLTGKTFNGVVVLGYAGKGAGNKPRFECRCHCGKVFQSSRRNLIRGKCRSCGCETIAALVSRSRKHGMSRTPTYSSYRSMLRRCRDASLAHYGANGITVCARWQDGDGKLSGFECFMADMGERPSLRHSIDRLNVNGNYEPKNCRWATPAEQIRNRTNTRFVIYRGQRVALGDACEMAGVRYGTVLQRLASGMSADDALSKPSAADKWPKLTPEQEREIAESPRHIAKIARQYGITRSRVYSIKKHFGLEARKAA